METLVYLDSQDYSNLSGPNSDSGQLAETKQKLVNLSKSNKVQFIFSSILVTEISPLNKLSTDRAKLRAEFLSQLCGRTTFKSLDSMLRAEFLSYGSERTGRDSLISRNGEWFPDVGNIIDGIDLGIDFKSISKKYAVEGANRQARRRANAGLLRNGKIRKSVLPHFLAMATGTFTEDLRKKYPMKEENLMVLLKHRLGYESRENAINSFMESFRDPAWMMQWFNSCSEELGVISNLYRSSANYLCDTLSKSANDLRCLIDMTNQLDKNIPKKTINKREFEKNCDSTMLAIGDQLLKHFYGPTTENIDISKLIEFCPGFSLFIKIGYAVIWDAITVQPRVLKPNDFMDAMHAFHVPYVDIFRADNYMANHINKITNCDAKIVSSIHDLPCIIENFIS